MQDLPQKIEALESEQKELFGVLADPVFKKKKKDEIAGVKSSLDRIEHEIWMMQAGGELWRLFLSAVPSADLLADSLMHVARMDPEPLEQLMMDLVEHPLTAKATIADFFDEDELEEADDEDFPDEYLGY